MSESSEKPEDLYDNETTNVHLSSSNKDEKCEVSNELLNYRDILLKNQFDLKKKEEEVQGYAEKLTKIKSKVKSRHSTESNTKVDESDDSIHDISDAKTPSEKSLLLKKKLEENRKIFELRNKELNESKRAAEVQVEKILQQLNDSSNSSIDIPFVNPIDDKDKQIIELNSKIHELESIIIDLKDSLSNKDSVIESKTKAITLVTDNLSQKSKVTLDKLEDTKDEMRHMQETFIATEEGLKIKINNLLSQLQERDSNIIEYEDKLKCVTSENDQLKSQINNFNEIISNKDKQIIELEEKLKLEEDLHNLINEKDNQIAKLQNNIQELNHNMIKLKAQSKSKLKNLQDRLDSYYKSSSSNEEEVNLVNKVAILEEEIGNLQLILVDFDEIKVVNDDLKKRITELEDQLTQKTEEIQSYNNKIVALENQKFELIQELHEVKQELVALDSLKYVEFEEKEELCNQDRNKDTTNDVTQNNLELIKILNQLQNQVNVVLNEKSALEEKFNKLTLYLNSSNETLTDLKSEIINLKHWNNDQCHVIQKVLSDLDENQLESTQRNYLLDYHQGLSDKNRNLELKVIEITNSIDIFRNAYEHLINDKNDWNNKFFFKNIDTSDINTLENLNIINLLTDNSFISDNNSQNENDTGMTVIVNLIKIFDLDEKHIDNSKLIINKLAKKLEKKTELLEESDHDKLLIDKLVSELDGLSSNMIEKRNSLKTMMNDTSLENEEFTNYKKLEILDKMQQRNELVTLLFEAIKNLKQNVEPHNVIMMLLDESIVPNFEGTSEETINSIRFLLKDQSVLEFILSLITQNFVDAITEKKEKFSSLEAQIPLILSDRDKLKEQLKKMDEKYEYVDEIKQKWDSLKTELNEKEKIMESLTAEKMKLKSSVERIISFNNECSTQISELEKKLLTMREIVAVQQMKFSDIESQSNELKDKIEKREADISSVDKWLAENEKLISKKSSKESKISSLSDQIKRFENQKMEVELLTRSNLARINELALEVEGLKQHTIIMTLNDEHEGDKLNIDTENKGTMLDSEEEKEVSEQRLEKIEQDSTLVLDNKRMLEDEIRIIDDKLESVGELHNKIATLENQLIEKDQLNNNNVIRINELTDEIVNLRETLVVCERNLTLALKDKETLEIEIREKEEKLQSLNEKYNENQILRDEVENKIGMIESIEKEKILLEIQFKEAKEINENNLAKNDKLLYEIDVLNQKLIEYEQNYTSILNDKKTLENEVKLNDEKLESINVLREQIVKLNEEIVNREIMIETMQNEKTMLENQLREKEHLNQESAIKMNQLSNEIMALNQRLTEYDEHFTIALNDKKLLTEQIKIKDEKLASMNELSSQIEQLTNAIRHKETHLESLSDKKNSLENELQQKTELAQDNALRIDQLTSEVSQLLKKNEEYEDQIRKSNEKLNSMNELYGQIEELDKKLTNKHLKMESIVNEKNMIENQLKEKEQMHQDNLVKIHELSNELDILHQQIAEQEENSMKIIRNKEILENELKTKDEKLKAVGELHQRIQQLSIEKEEQHAENTLKINTLLSEIDTLKTQITDYERDIAAISSDKEILENTIIKRNEQLKAMNCLKDEIVVLHTELTSKNHLIETLTTEKITLEEKLKEIENLKEKVDQLSKEIADKEVKMEEILKEKKILVEQLEDKKQLNETNSVKIEEFRKEIDGAKVEISKREFNITSLLDSTMCLEQELRKAKEQWSDDQEKLGVMENLNVQLENQVSYLNKIKSEMEFSQSAMKESRAKYMDNLNIMNAELENVVKSADNRLIEDTNKIAWLEQELESVKQHNANQMQKMRIIAANLKKKTNQCQEFESAAKEFKEKWENEVSEKKELNMKLEALELNLNDKDLKIAEFGELLEKRENDLQYLKEKIEVLESDINNRVVQFNNLREKIVTELENCKKEHLVDESLKETYKKILELGTQVKEMELRNISDWSLLGLLKSESEDLFSHSYLHELQENTGVDYSDKHNIFEFVASKIIEDAGTDRKDFKNIISKMAEKYVIIESLKFRNKKLTEIIDSIHANRQVPNEQLQSSQIIEPLQTETKDESVTTVSDAIVQEETDRVEENIEEVNQPPINLDDEEVWGWNEENTGPSEFKIPVCTPETQLQVKIAELEDKVKDLQDKKMEVDEELKVIQLKNKKLIKKLQEYKIQNYNLQQQVKLQTNSSKFNDLDYTIEEELKSQITQLEINLNKLKEDNEKISTERDNLLNKIEILTATKDELNKTMAMKNNELLMQIQHLGQSIQSNDSVEKFSAGKSTDTESGVGNQDKCIEHEEKIFKLEENLNEILSENNELKALIDTYETELNLKTKEMEKLSNQTEYSKLNFFNMLGESHTEKKECLDNLSDVFAKSENIEASHQSTEKEKLENDELKTTIATLKEVEQELNAKISKLEQDLQEKKNEINEMNLSFNHLESLWNSEIKTRVEMEQEHEEIKNKLYATEEELKEVILINEQKIADSKTLTLSLQNHTNNLRQELEAKNEEIMTISSNYNDLRHIFDEQLQKNNELQSRYDQIVDEFKLKISEFDQQYQEKEMKIERLEQSLKETLESLHSKVQELSDLEHKLRELENSSKNETSEAVSELQTIQLLESGDLVDQETHLSEETYDKSKKDHDNYSKSYEDLQRQLTEVNEAMTNVTDLLNIRVQEVADLKQYIKKLEFDKMAVDNTNAELTSVNLKLNDKNQELTHHLNRLKEELDEKNEVILSLEAQLIELQALYDSAISDLNNQSLEIKSLKDVINNNEDLIQNLEASVTNRDTQISNVREELSDCHHKIEELSTMISHLQNSMISPEIFNEKLHEIKRLEETIETMKGEHSVLTDEYEKKLSENTIALDELKCNLSIKSEEVEDLKYILNENTYPRMIQELQDKIDHLYEEKQQLLLSVAEKTDELSSQTNRNKNSPDSDDQNQVKDSISSELDAALYMLHQRDVRCEELTHELLQLLEERDTLQLRLSNAIKINEELKKYTPSTSKVLADDLDSGFGGESISSSTTLAKPLESKEDMEVLNQKLSQLHNVNYHRDIRLIDERESRHIQQMSVIPHKNTLTPSSTDSSARIIDANYTVSRDVQSQPNVLLNWLWGKSTPKVTHM